MGNRNTQGNGEGADRSTVRFGQRERNELVLPLHRKALLQLQAAETIERYWAATQALIAASAPSSTRWFCVRPIKMATALMLLRETPAARGQARPAGEEDEAAQLKDLFARHPAMLHFRRNLGASLVHLKPEKTEARSEASQDLLRERRWEFGVALAFWKRKRIEGFLLLHRTATEGDFSSTELASLRELQPHLETALGRLISARGHQAQKSSVAGIFRSLPLPLLLCDSKLRIVCESAAGLLARTGWELGDERANAENSSSRRPLPEDLARFCQARIDAWEKAKPAQRIGLEREKCEFEHASASHLRAKVQMIRPKGFPLSRPQLLIRFDLGARVAANDEPLRDGNFEVLSRLTARERELALLIREGHGNERIARELGKSLHTIKAQLGSIYAKLKVRSRSQLAARLNRGLLCLAPWVLDSVFDGVTAALTGGLIIDSAHRVITRRIFRSSDEKKRLDFGALGREED